MSPLSKAWHLVTHLGPGWVFFRVRYALRRRTGLLRRCTPALGWDDIPCPASDRRDWLAHQPQDIGPGCLSEAEDILAGRFRLFSCHQVTAGFPPVWARNQLTGETAPANRHWSTLGDFAFGDIKGVWELSRFPWAFALARAYARTGDERFAEGYWRLFEDWLRHNPPNLGPNWMCGQEAAFRLIAATFGRYVLAGSPTSHAVRLAAFRRLVVATGRRIEANLDYALSQSNNHGISECVGLLVAASVTPAAPEAAGWWERGMRSLQDQLRDLVYADGGFSQHSVVYHRVLVHDLLIARLAMKAAGKEMPAWFRDAGRRAAEFLGTLITPETGEVPLYGSNDGANILPMADADFLDFRPTWQAASVVFWERSPLSPGPWDELPAWLDRGFGQYTKSVSAGRSSEGEAAAKVKVVQQVADIKSLELNGAPRRVHFSDSGCLVWWSGAMRLFMRCPTAFRHRPSQSDLLHVDINWAGQRIAHDLGSYSYNTKGPFKGALKEAAVHNTTTFDYQEPLKQVGSFLFLPWPKGSADWLDDGRQFQASHTGWSALKLQHTRRISSPKSGVFAVEDVVWSYKRRVGRLHWLLADLPHSFEPGRCRIVLRARSGYIVVRWEANEAVATLVRADSKSVRGWWAPRYFQAVPALSLAIEFKVQSTAAITTWFEAESAPQPRP